MFFEMAEVDSQAPWVSVIVISHNRHEDLAETLSYIDEHAPPQVGEIVVVDNGSVPPILLSELRLPAMLIRLHRNMGVSFGRNVGAQNAKYPYLLFLDDDCRCDLNAIGAIVIRMRADQSICVVGLNVCNVSRKEALKAEFDKYKRLSPKMRSFEKAGTFIGAGFLVRRDAFIKLGGFDDMLFYSMEETDFSFRAMQHGYRIEYTDECVVLHYVSEVARPRGQKVRQYYKNFLRIIWRYYPLTWAVYSTVRAAGSAIVHGVRDRKYLYDAFSGLVAAIPLCVSDVLSGKRVPAALELVKLVRSWSRKFAAKAQTGRYHL